MIVFIHFDIIIIIIIIIIILLTWVFELAYVHLD